MYEGGALFTPEVLEITDEMMMEKVMVGIAEVAALSLGTGYPTLASLPHSVINAYKNVLAIAVETDYSFPLADKVGDKLVLNSSLGQLTGKSTLHNGAGLDAQCSATPVWFTVCACIKH